MQPVSPRVVELFNEALTFELTVTNTYFLHARMLENGGLAKLGTVFYELEIDVGEDAEEMLRLALESEKAAVAQFNASAKECHDLGDHGSAAVFEEMVRDEEKHADWFESQIDAIERVGIQQYLAQQIEAGEAP